MAPYGSAIKAWPSGQIMATPDYPPRYPVRYARPVASARLAAFRRKRPIDVASHKEAAIEKQGSPRSQQVGRW